jgi:hypothetical protein
MPSWFEWGELPSYPITGIIRCCALAASGHSAAQPSNVMKRRKG